MLDPIPAGKGFEPRLKQFPVPEAAVFDSPYVTLCINAEWASFIATSAEVLLDKRLWIGDYDYAEQQILGAYDQLLKLGSCDQYRIDPENPCIIQVSHDGTTWETFIDVTACYTPTDPDLFIKRTPFSNENTIHPTDSSIGLYVDMDDGADAIIARAKHAISFHAISLADISGFHGYPLFIESPTTRSDKTGLLGYKDQTASTIELLNFEGAIIPPEKSDISDGQDNTARHNGIYAHYKSFPEIGSELYACLQDEFGSWNFVKIGPGAMGPPGEPGADGEGGADGEDGADGAGITAVDLEELVPSGEAYAFLSEPTTPQEQQLNIGINRGVGIAEISAVTLDPGSDADIETTTNDDGDLVVTLGIPRGEDGSDGTLFGDYDMPEPGVSKTYVMYVSADDVAYFPKPLTPGIRVELVEAQGFWGYDNSGGNVSLVMDKDGYTDIVLGHKGYLQFGLHELSSTFLDEWNDTIYTDVPSAPVSVDTVLGFSGEWSGIAGTSLTSLRSFLEVRVTLGRSDDPFDWMHEFDFGVDNGGWTTYGSGCAFDSASYEGGTWSDDHPHGDRYNAFGMVRNWTDARTIVAIEVDARQHCTGGTEFIDIRNYANITMVDGDSDCVTDTLPLDLVTDPSVPTATWRTLHMDIETPLSIQSQNIQITTNAGTASGSPVQIQKIRLYGLGTDPF